MDQTLDMQVAALIFLAGTRCLVTSDHAGDVETTSENTEESDEPAPEPLIEGPLVPIDPYSQYFQPWCEPTYCWVQKT
ncbi:MAG: hypothetical protein CMA79_02210 [Euryarchaeota archaeon]|nr:hypothetical protein [Euryarchaeota archaeon]|tara:strand:- start:12572 stop:12805 length:234 start_codon:yes stop_codon:yes gene_type:complete